MKTLARGSKLVGLVALAALTSLAGCATATASHRKTDYGEKGARVAEAALDEAEQQLDALEVAPAEKGVATAREALEHPDIEYYPERNVLRARLQKLEARLVSVRGVKARMERDAVVARQQAKVLDSVERLDAALVPLRSRAVSEADVTRAKEAFSQTRDVLRGARQMEYQYVTYGKFAQETEAALTKKRGEIVLAEGVLAFVNGPAAQREKARATLKEAATASTMARPALYRQALGNLNSCKISGKEMLTTVDNLEKSPVLVNGEATTPKAVTQFCEARAQLVEKRIAEATKEAQRAQARRVPPPLPRPKRK